MASHEYPDHRLTVQMLRAEYGLSEKTWRRALSDPTDPLPHQRVGLGGDPKHSRILVRRADLEAWLARRNAAASPKSIIDAIVGKVFA